MDFEIPQTALLSHVIALDVDTPTYDGRSLVLGLEGPTSRVLAARNIATGLLPTGHKPPQSSHIHHPGSGCPARPWQSGHVFFIFVMSEGYGQDMTFLSDHFESVQDPRGPLGLSRS